MKQRCYIRENGEAQEAMARAKGSLQKLCRISGQVCSNTSGFWRRGGFMSHRSAKCFTAHPVNHWDAKFDRLHRHFRTDVMPSCVVNLRDYSCFQRYWSIISKQTKTKLAKPSSTCFLVGAFLKRAFLQSGQYVSVHKSVSIIKVSRTHLNSNVILPRSCLVLRCPSQPAARQAGFAAAQRSAQGADWAKGQLNAWWLDWSSGGSPGIECTAGQLSDKEGDCAACQLSVCRWLCLRAAERPGDRLCRKTDESPTDRQTCARVQKRSSILDHRIQDLGSWRIVILIFSFSRGILEHAAEHVRSCMLLS